MEKKNLKWYEAPQVEVVEMEANVTLLAGSDGVTVEPGGNDGPYDGEW